MNAFLLQAAQAFLRLILPTASLPLWFVKEMPKQSSKLTLDFSSLLGPLFYAWIIQLLLPVSRAHRSCVSEESLGD